ncbi:MAG: hypothetical protein ABIP55_11175 [Tepidisphaeraceae bacterium]
MNEYSFLVCERGLWVLAITSPQLDHRPPPWEFLSTRAAPICRSLSPTATRWG